MFERRIRWNYHTEGGLHAIFKTESIGGTSMDILGTFGDNVRKYRLERHLSQEAFAEKCGLHRTYISAVERHKRSISLNNIQKIADALDIDTYLLFLEPNMTHPRIQRRRS